MTTHTGPRTIWSGPRAIVVMIVLAAWPLHPMAEALNANRTSMSFGPEGTIRMDLDVGTIEVVGVVGDRITVSWHSTAPREERDVAATVQRTGDDTATVVVDGPGNRMRYRIEVPRQSNIAIRMHAGNLDVRGVVGNLDADLLFGNLDLRVAEPAHYHNVSAAVTAGGISAPAWRTDTGGLWRSFRRSGDGDYDLRARLLAGQLTIRSE